MFYKYIYTSKRLKKETNTCNTLNYLIALCDACKNLIHCKSLCFIYDTSVAHGRNNINYILASADRARGVDTRPSTKYV